MAGRRRAARRARALSDSFEQSGWRVETLHTARPGDARELARQYAPGYDLVVCCGGDGTLHELLCGMMDARATVPAGYIPAGTTNDMARTLQLPVELRAAVRAVTDGQARARDVGRFGGGDYFCYVACFGAFADVSYRTPQWLKNMLGYGAYFICTCLGLPGFHPYELEWSADGGAPQRGRYLFGSVSNARTLSGIFRFKESDVQPDDGAFELMLLRAPENPVQFFQMAHALIHQQTDGRLVVFRHVRAVKFRFARATSWTLDGERAGPVVQADLEVLPRAVRLVF